jgi:hypothetical protein
MSSAVQQTIMEFRLAASHSDSTVERAFFEAATPEPAMIEAASRALRPRPDVWLFGLSVKVPGFEDRLYEAIENDTPLMPAVHDDILLHNDAVGAYVDGRGMQANDPGRANYVRLAIQECEPLLQGRRFAIVEYGASAGLILHDLEASYPDATLIGLDVAPLSVENTEDMAWLRVQTARGEAREELDAAIVRARARPPMLMKSNDTRHIDKTIELLRRSGHLEVDTPVILLHSMTLGHVRAGGDAQLEGIQGFTERGHGEARFRIGIEPAGLFPATMTHPEVFSARFQYGNRATLVLLDTPDQRGRVLAVGDNRGKSIFPTEIMVDQPLEISTEVRRATSGHRQPRAIDDNGRLVIPTTGPVALEATSEGFAL